MLQVQPLRILPSEESKRPVGRILAALDLQDGVVAHLDRLKTARDILGEGDMRARIEKLLRY